MTSPPTAIVFRELEAQGKERIEHQIGELRQSLRNLKTESVALQDRMEARIQELTKIRTEAVRESILKSQEDQFTRYSLWIRKVLDQSGEGLKLGIQGLILRLLLMDTEMKLALSGVGLKEPVRAPFAVAPPAGLEPATRRLTRPSIPLIEDSIYLLQVKSRNEQSKEPRRSRRPICNLALVASAA